MSQITEINERNSSEKGQNGAETEKDTKARIGCNEKGRERDPDPAFQFSSGSEANLK
jgi:hypothetical protein